MHMDGKSRALPVGSAPLLPRPSGTTSVVQPALHHTTFQSHDPLSYSKDPQ